MCKDNYYLYVFCLLWNILDLDEIENEMDESPEQNEDISQHSNEFNWNDNNHNNRCNII